ncbi:MAG TPA: trypsin-like peptidase domain-containing protein [Planctomycetaceae bacterium]|nr:trypsin-like peptidase domain-containing protein [Planctomycetaceae bacterium]
MVKAIRRAQASVVNINSEKTAFDRDTYTTGTGRKINGMGSGIIIDERGYIVTNQHVISDVDSLSVTLIDGSTHYAKIISYDRKHDLAIIKINAPMPLQVMPLGTSSDLMLGETVITVGNPFGYTHSVTSGIVSSLSRDVEVNEKQGYKNLIQTDASINPGNSGGPLINLEGDVVGINVAIRAGAQRIGFAIPIDDARGLIARLLNVRRLDGTWHGVTGRDMKTATEKKFVVTGLESDSPAMRAGVRSGDVITQIATTRVHDQADFERAILGHQPGDKLTMIVKRDQGEQTLTLDLAASPGAAPQPAIARHQVGQQTSGVQAPVVRAKSPDAVDEQNWSSLGLRLVKLPDAQFQAMRSRYRGGLKVVDVRPESPASQNGIKQGDILVGLHEWETVSPENVAYVLNHPKLVSFNPVKFYIIRGQETLFGQLQLTIPTAAATPSTSAQ